MAVKHNLATLSRSRLDYVTGLCICNVSHIYIYHLWRLYVTCVNAWCVEYKLLVGVHGVEQLGLLLDAEAGRDDELLLLLPRPQPRPPDHRQV